MRRTTSGWMRMRRWRSVAAAAAFLALVAGAGAAVSVLDEPADVDAGPQASADPAAWQGLVGGARPSVALGQRVIVVLNAPSLAERVRKAGGEASDAQQRAWTAAALAGQEQFLSEMAEQGIVARPSLRFTRVLNGFSAIADPVAVAVLERSPDVAGVYPVRAAFPAAVSLSERSGASPIPAEPAGFPGRGVTVALLDTAVGPSTPHLGERVLAGFDVISGGVAARYDQRPGGTRLETHGTVMAGILVGNGLAGRTGGVAPGATLLPIRVAGWQRDASGRWSIHARTDQIVAGLERAVDPDRDGDAHDAARVTLVPLVEPFAAFADGPLARAVAGAAGLDTLVVTPAGNEGPAGPVFGNVAGPGGAPDALTVGAVDVRSRVRRVPVLVRSGLRVIQRHPFEQLTAVPPPEGTFEAVVVDDPRALFDDRGSSRVAGRAAVLTTAGNLRQAASLASGAGAALVVASGDDIPSGALALGPELTVPILAGGAALAESIQAEANAGRTVWLSTGRAVEASSPLRGRPASFTSWGLAFGGDLKPELVAAGVGVASALPGQDPAGRSRFVTASGTSAAAAVVAGVAARLAQARPSLDAAGLRGALVGTARPAGRSTALAQGMGIVDASAAATAEVIVVPASISFGRSAGDGWRGEVPLALRNTSTRDLTVYLDPRGAIDGVVLELTRDRVTIPAGKTARVVAGVRLTGVAGQAAASGTIRVDPRDGTPVDVPWTTVLAPPGDLIGDAELSEESFSPSDLTPAVLAVRVGTIVREDGRDMIEPVRRFDVMLQDDRGRTLGLLARLRDALPGRYAFGITGRGPGGKPLRPGAYKLRLVAWPVAGGAPVVRVVPFSVE